MRDRIYINGSYRDTILKEWDEKNILGLHIVDTKEIFNLAVVLGMNEPNDIKAKKDGYFLIQNVKSYDKALYGCLLLGKKENQDNIDEYANVESSYDEAERSANSGFMKLKEIIDSADGDEELLEKQLFAELEILYEKNVRSNI